MRPSVGILLPSRGLLLRDEAPRDAEWILSLAEAAEEGGVESLWVGDSLTAKPRMEPLTLLAALAARTRKARIGTAVLLPALRHPVLSSHALSTLDVISGGRLTIAAGVGGAFVEPQKREWWAAGVDPKDRACRLEEWVQVVKRLTRGETVTFEGRHFKLDSVKVPPRSPQPGGVPVLLACHWATGKDRQYRRAIQLADGYIGISDSPQDWVKLKDRLQELATEEGRDFNTMDSVFYMTVNLNEDEAKAEQEANDFVLKYYGINFWKDKWGPFGSPQRVVERMEQFAQAGVRSLILRFASFEQQKQLDLFLEQVLPAFRSLH